MPIEPKAMVLAAGLGLRMRPLTEDRPKPLIPVAGVTLIDRLLDWLADSGVQEAVVNSHWRAEMLEAHLKGRRKPHVTVSHEPQLLETDGGLKKALPLLGSEPFFSINSDVICLDGPTPALHRLKAAWSDDTDALLLLHPVETAIGYDGKGDFFLNGDGTLRRREGERAPYVFTGVQLLHPRLFADSPEGPFSLNLLYNRAMQQAGPAPRVRALAHDGHWLHVGDLRGLTLAEDFLANRRSASS